MKTFEVMLRGFEPERVETTTWSSESTPPAARCWMSFLPLTDCVGGSTPNRGRRRPAGTTKASMPPSMKRAPSSGWPTPTTRR